MNKVILVGRLAQSPYKNVTASNVEYSRFTVAVRRNYTGPNNETITDFVPCVAWRQNAMFINKYLVKGSLVSIEGSFQSQRITNEQGQMITAYSVNVDQITSLESREVSEQRRKSNENNNQFNISNDVVSNTNNNQQNNNSSGTSNSEWSELSWE